MHSDKTAVQCPSEHSASHAWVRVDTLSYHETWAIGGLSGCWTWGLSASGNDRCWKERFVLGLWEGLPRSLLRRSVRPGGSCPVVEPRAVSSQRRWPGSPGSQPSRWEVRLPCQQIRCLCVGGFCTPTCCLLNVKLGPSPVKVTLSKQIFGVPVWLSAVWFSCENKLVY